MEKKKRAKEDGIVYPVTVPADGSQTAYFVWRIKEYFKVKHDPYRR